MIVLEVHPSIRVVVEIGYGKDVKRIPFYQGGSPKVEPEVKMCAWYARELAKALVEAADELDKERDPWRLG